MSATAILEWLHQRPEGAGITEICSEFGLPKSTATMNLIRRAGAVLVGASFTAVWAHPAHVETAAAARDARAAERHRIERQKKLLARRAEHKRSYAERREPPLSDVPVIRIVPALLAKPPHTRAIRSVWELAA